jgi:hypothetical protein
MEITGRDTVSKIVTITAGGLPTGTYYVTLFSNHCLVIHRANVTINETGNNTYMGTLLAGDAQDFSEGNTIINITDFGRFAAAYEKSSGHPRFDASADFDESDHIDIMDFTLLYTNFGKTSPQTVN